MFSHLFSSLNLGLAATHEKVSMRVCEQPRFDDGGLGPFATFGCLVAKIAERKVIGGSTAKAKTKKLRAELVFPNAAQAEVEIQRFSVQRFIFQRPGRLMEDLC